MAEYWDAFISHAWEDKEHVARPLALALQSSGIKVWFDEFTLRVGDSLSQSINSGIARCRYGIVVLSPNFLSKKWTQDELGGILAREELTNRILLPVWHGISVADLRERAPILADRVAARWSDGIDEVLQQLLGAMTLSTRADHIGGDWLGETGRLRLKQLGTMVRGDYDWNEHSWAGHLHGEVHANVFRFRWAWSGSAETGRGYLVHDAANAMLRGGWVFSTNDVDIEAMPPHKLETLVNTWEFRRAEFVDREYRLTYRP